MILQRLLHPASKLATTRLWHTTTLAEELSLETPTRTISMRPWTGCWSAGPH